MATSKPVKKIGKQVTVKQVNKYNYKVNKEIALSMALQGKTVTEIAEHFQVSLPAISQLLKADRDNIEGYKAFKSSPDTIYEFKEYQLLNNLNPAKIEKMSGYQIVGSAGLIRDKVRTERSQATLITDDMNSIIDRIEQRYSKEIDVTPKEAIPNDVA